VKALSQYTITEILEMGIDGVWIGYEGTRSGYAKQQGRPIGELFRELRDHGVSVLTSMIVGLPYQTPEIIEEELDGLMELQPTLSQFLIYGPTPGTPFYERVMHEGLLHKDLDDHREEYYRNCTGFKAMVTHPTMTPAEIESSQTRCFSEDVRRLGPSMFRSIDVWLRGYLKLKDSPNATLRLKAGRFRFELRRTYPVFLAGKLFARGAEVRAAIARLERRVHESLGAPSLRERVSSLAAACLAAWTALTLKLGLFQHPSLTRIRFRIPDDSLPARVWRRLHGEDEAGHRVRVELRPESTVWVTVGGSLSVGGAEKLASELLAGLRRRKERLVLDLEGLVAAESAAIDRLAEHLRDHADRVRMLLPQQC